MNGGGRCTGDGVKHQFDVKACQQGGDALGREPGVRVVHLVKVVHHVRLAASLTAAFRAGPSPLAPFGVGDQADGEAANAAGDIHGRFLGVAQLPKKVNINTV